MTAYALSLLTNRHFIIDLSDPCDFDKIFTPNKVNWRMFNYNLRGKTNTSINCIKFYRNCFNDYKSIKNLNVDVIYVTATMVDLLDWYIPKQINLELEKDILRLGLVKDVKDFTLRNMFHKWYNELFQLETQLEEKYVKFKHQAKLNNHTQIFCAQIRIGGKRDHVEVDSQFNHRKVTKLFWNFIRTNFIENENWRLFVTSDIKEVEMEAISEFGKDKVIRIDGMNTHIGFEKSLGKNCSRIEKPILDFHFLANCDKAVISHSNYGGLGVSNRMQPDKDLHYLGYSWTRFYKDTYKNFKWKFELQEFINKRHNTSVRVHNILKIFN
jgi:hypothetical protein